MIEDTDRHGKTPSASFGTFICANCKREFPCDDPSEVEAEYREQFPTVSDGSQGPPEAVCTECYEQIMNWIDEEGLPR